MTGFVRRVALAVGWLATAAVIALGAAGLVGVMAHPPGTPARAELTSAGDAVAGPIVTQAETDLIDLTDDVRRLGQLARGALAALAADDSELVAETVGDGGDLVEAIEADAIALDLRLETLPGSGPTQALTLSPSILARRERAREALTATEGLGDLWSRLAAGAATAARVRTLLEDHDRVAGEAAAIGRDGDYAGALVGLDAADALIAEARTLRDGLRNTVDVSTLTQWLDRNAEYDAALRHLYQSLVDSNGIVNDEVRQAFRDERAARELLPADTQGLVIILAEIAQGGLTQAVIGIEEARGRLEARVVEIIAAGSPGASGEASPEPSPPAEGSAAP